MSNQRHNGTMRKGEPLRPDVTYNATGEEVTTADGVSAGDDVDRANSSQRPYLLML